jgi:hypothetical protein
VTGGYHKITLLGHDNPFEILRYCFAENLDCVVKILLSLLPILFFSNVVQRQELNVQFAPQLVLAYLLEN